MAGENGQPSDHLKQWQALQGQPTRFTLFAALRLAEQRFADQPRLGESRKAADDSLRLAQRPHLYFAPSDVASFEQEDRPLPVLYQYGFGMFGPNGVLPLHLTELAQGRERQSDDPAITDFVNVFQHRLISLFYRAWADADPSTNFDRPDQDRFRTYAGAFAGLSQPGARGRDSVVDYAKLSRCGNFAPHSRSAEGLESILTDYFELAVEVRAFVGSWLDIAPDSQCRLGGAPEYASLGTTATLGQASWQCQHKFEIVLGPLTLHNFADFLPGARGLRELNDLVRMYTNDEWEWQLRLLLEEVEIPGMKLGQGGKLGWTSWLGAKHRTADDVVLQGDAQPA